MKQSKNLMVNYIPKSAIEKTLKSNLHPYINAAKIKGSLNLELSMFFTLRNLLFFILEDQPLEIKNYVNLKLFIKKVLNEFYSFQSEGFVNQRNLECNRIFNIFRSFYPRYSEIFKVNKPSLVTWGYELEHFHNLIILVLLFEIELYLTNNGTVEGEEEEEENDDLKIEERDLLKQDRLELNSLLSGGIRLSLSKNRLLVTDRIYVGFDTEFKTIDSLTNKILCYTTSTLTESFIKIRDGNVDFSLKDGINYFPQTSNLISAGVFLVRSLRGKKDFELEELKNILEEDTSLTCLKLNNQDLLYKRCSEKVNSMRSIKSTFFDVRENASKYSFKSLLDETLVDHNQPLFLDNLRQLGFNPTLKRECFLTAHFTTADVSLFSDFEEIKDKFTVLNKSFLTLDRTISYKKWKVFLRDSSLLTPAGMGLKSIGSLYPDLPLAKIDLSKEDLNAMDVFFERDRVAFEMYALQDSKIVLWHVLQVQESHYQLTGKYTIPVTLSSLASSFLTKRLLKETSSSSSYHPKTKNGLISVKDLARLNTPVGIELSGDLHEYIDYFLGSYHGGRNESFIYGVVKGEFYDYDLPGAYPTAMAMLDYPDWDSREMIGGQNGDELFSSLNYDLIKSYTALKIKFEFPSTVKYPNIPVRLDFSSVVFPLTGETFCTGHEFLLAMRLGCRIKILSGVYIPFKNSKLNSKLKLKSNSISNLDSNSNSDSNSKRKFFVQDHLIKQLFELKYSDKTFDSIEKSIYKSENYYFLKQALQQTPVQTEIEAETEAVTEAETGESNFYLVVKELIQERVKHPKGSYMNLLYKFLANAGIGQMARGLNQKVKFDVRSNSTKPLPSGELVSPLYAGWITSYIRTTLSEIMNGQENDRENYKIISCTTDGFISDEPNMDSKLIDSTNVFSLLYYNMRLKLTGVGALLETKYIESDGVISWRTRGQLGLSGGIKALTGYQRHESIEQTIDKVNKSFTSSKQIAFIQTSLRSAKDIYFYGGHSTLTLNERFFNLKFDNRREITECKGTYHITKPFIHSLNSLQNRVISTFGSGRYRKYSPISKTQCKGDAYLTLTRRMIVRVLRDPELIQLNFNRKEIYKILKEIGLKCTLNFISKQKGKLPVFNSVPSTQKTLACLTKLKGFIPFFKPELLLRN